MIVYVIICSQEKRAAKTVNGYEMRRGGKEGEEEEKEEEEKEKEEVEEEAEEQEGEEEEEC